MLLTLEISKFKNFSLMAALRRDEEDGKQTIVLSPHYFF